MINYDSILSAFDGKPTLLQWLKLVKKALDESVLKDITLKQDGANAIFTFNFEDGTSISTPAVTLPKGDTGAKGDKGDKGEHGVSVTGVDEVSHEVVGTQTLTTLRFNFSNGTNNEVIVHAENGKSGSSKIYLHNVKISDPNAFSSIYFNMYSVKQTITLEDALSQIPTRAGSATPAQNRMPVALESMRDSGVVMAYKYLDGKKYQIKVYGIVFEQETNTVKTYEHNFLAARIDDTLLGENL